MTPNPLRPISLTINGETHQTLCRNADLLLHVLRTHFGLMGAKTGCLNGDCGTCTILVNEIPTKSCLMLAVEVEASTIETIEGLHSPLQQAFIDHNAFQCGYCTPGFIMNIEGLIRHNPQAADSEIEDWLQSNICRCTSYEEIKAATYAVLKNKREKRIEQTDSKGDLSNLRQGLSDWSNWSI